jgi:hypothetical protein
MPRPPGGVYLELLDEAAVAVLVGEHDTATYGLVVGAIAAARRSRRGVVVADLSRCVFLDPRVLIGVAEDAARLEPSGRRFAVVMSPATAAGVRAVVEASGDVAAYASVSAAIAGASSA